MTAMRARESWVRLPGREFFFFPAGAGCLSLPIYPACRRFELILWFQVLTLITSY
jgi:hypothetical protein